MPTRKAQARHGSALAAALALAACSNPSPTAAPGAPTPPAAEVRHELPPGTLLRLLPLETVRPGAFDDGFAGALLREALRQSVRFDVAAGIDDVRQRAEGMVEVAVQADPVAGVLTTTLLSPDSPPVPLAQARYGHGDLPAAIDRLAWATRTALGEAPRPEAAPVPVALAYTAAPDCAARTEDALRQMVLGRFEQAERLLVQARRLDGGSPMVLDALAGLQSVRGQSEAARRTAQEGLGYRQRLAPTTAHRLARTVLLANASLRADLAPRYDRELLQLAEVTLQERPYDPQPLLSKALALNFLSRFEEAVGLLRRLAVRLPGNPTVAYHLGFAELALGRPAAALAAFDRAARHLPEQTTVLPRAIALFEAGEHGELEALLDRLARDPAIRKGSTYHEVLRMRAAHAILRDRPADASRWLLEDLEWLRQRPSLLDQRALDLSDEGQVLVQLGAADELARHLHAILELRPEPQVRDALAFLLGLVEVAKTGRRAEATEASLAQSGEMDAYSNVLRAAAHHRRGELLDELSALARAARLSDSPLVTAATIRALRAAGRSDEADALRDRMRAEMREVHLRRHSQHPLLDPARALAYVVE